MSFTTFFGDRFDRVLGTLPKLFGPLDPHVIKAFEEQVEWVELRGGETLFRHGEVGDCMYIVAGGRLHAVVHDDSGKPRVVGEVARGEPVGEMALLTGEPRAATVCAARDSLLMRLERSVFDRLVRQHPDVLLCISRTIIDRMTASAFTPGASPEIINVALVPLSPQAPVREVAHLLESSLAAHGAVIRLTAERVDEMTGVPGRSQAPETGHDHVRLAAWLDRQSLLHRFVLFEASCDPSPWTSCCIRQADRVLLIAPSATPPQPSPLERALFPHGASACSTPRELVLVHPSSAQPPTATAHWYEGRNVARHHHVRLDQPADWQRLARYLAGAAVGIVFAGGGARGFAHIGVQRALVEAGVPVDMAGGTSMGAVIAACVASGWDQQTLLEANRKVALDHPFNDYNLLPTVSLLKGQKIDRLLRGAFGEMAVDDLWLPFFCVSSNLTRAEMAVHRRGPVWKAVRASLSIPGILPPVVFGDDLHVDGATFNNIPVDVMSSNGAGRIIASDIDVRKDQNLDYTEVPSSWDVLKSRILPNRPRITAPGMVDTVFKASFLGGCHQREAAQGAHLYFHPDVHSIGLLDFGSFDEAVEIGYRHAVEQLQSKDLAHLGLQG